MGRRSEKSKKVRRQGLTQHSRNSSSGIRVSCFVCDEEITGKGVPLLISHTSHSKTGLPAKIGELMGDGFMVVVSMEDTLCRRCSSLINHLDKLEADLFLVKKALTDYLKVKYQLTDEDLAGQQAAQVEEEDCELLSNVSVKGDADCYPVEDTTLDVDNGEEPYEYEEPKTDSEESDAESSGATKRVNLQIILEDSSSQRRPSLGQEKPYKCPSCDFETSDSQEYSQHQAGQCQEPQHKCTICGKIFESNKNIQNHIMQAHLSKWTCYFCQASFVNETEFTEHMKLHLDSCLIKPEPGQSDTSDCSDLARNLRTNYECNTCNICDFQTNNKFTFRDHLCQHVLLKKCSICGLRFEDDVTLRKHELEHKKEVLGFSTANELGTPAESHEDVDANVKTVSLSQWDMARDENFLNDSNSSDMGKNVKPSEISEKSHDADDKCFQFHTCSSCSLTFVNDTLFKEHMKSHNIIIKDIVKHENSVISSIIEPNDYAESVMDDSLEDIFAKMNSQSETSFDKGGDFSEKHSFKCGICNEEFIEAKDLEIHKVKHLTPISQLSEPNTEECDLGIQQNLGDVSESGGLNADYLKPALSSSSVIDGEEEEEGKDDCLENIYKMVYEKKLSSIDATNSLILDSESFLKLKSEEFDFTPKEELDLPTVNDNVVPENKVATKKTYVCAICGFKSSSMIELKRHFKYHKEVGEVNCKVCNRAFTSHLNLRQHMKTDHEFQSILPLSEKLSCPNCFLDMPDETSLLEHLQEQHPQDKMVFQCLFCERQFTTRKALKVHKLTHRDKFEKFTYSCDECNKTFMKEKQLSCHKDLEHRDPHCKYCGKEILKLKTLRNHELRHQKERGNYECDICKRVFKTKTGLRHHVAVHTGEYKYCCDYCGRGFMSRMMMEEHRSMHTKEERYICDVCGRKFSFQSTYWIHRKWHDNPYPYKCSFCGRMFRHSSLLAVHKRKHTGERPYKCPHCPLSFPVGGTLKRHLILHTGVYPFNCDNCKRGFTTRHKYATHLAKTHGDFDLLNARQQQNDFKMVIREDAEPQVDQETTTVWQFADDSEQGETMNFKLAVAAAAGADGLESLEAGIPCSIVSEDLLSDNMPTRVVEIVLDEASQAVATVTLADSLLPELWYQ